jgi:hypothetical protein
MAKRVRGSTSRPGQRPPLQRQAARPAARTVSPTVAAPEPLPDDLTPDEEARAAVLEAAIVAQERQAETTNERARATRPVETPRVSTLTISAAEEYSYVARDVRRIAIVGGSLIILLLVLWALSHILGMGPL